MLAYPVKFRPIPQERIWGGNKLKEWFGAEDNTAPIGEYWVLSGHPTAVSVVVNGEYAGQTLNELIAKDEASYLGNSPQPRFPLLIKFLEATADLSVQIHPNDVYAQRNENDFGKTEAWYVLDTLPGGRVNYGHNFSNRESYLQAVKDNRVKDFLEYRTISKDDVVFVPAQTLHALLAGTIVLEVQQTSDVTYRVYDWDRVDDHGQPRALHIEKAADVMQYGTDASGLNGDGMSSSGESNRVVIAQTTSLTHHRLLTCDYFTLEYLSLVDGETTLSRGKAENPDVLIGIEGDALLRWDDGEMTISQGDTVLIPTNVTSYSLVATSSFKGLRTYY